MAKITYEEKMLTKKRIEDAAKEVFAEKGVLKASIREVAKRAGVGASTIYGYYPSKPLLFIETILPSIESRESMKDMLDRIDLKTATMDEIVESIADASFVLPRSMHQFDRKLIREIHMVLFNQADGLEDIRKRMEHFLESEIIIILENFFNKILDEGIMIVDVSSRDMAEFIISIMRLIFLEYVIILAYSEEECYERLKKFIRLTLIGKIKCKS